MPSDVQLQSEVWWMREYQPPSIARLCDQMREYFGVSPNALGSKGDNNHLYGYHRSRAWILSSVWSAYRDNDYSVEAGADQAGDENWLCAIDFTPGDAAAMITVCQRLDTAVRAGLCPQLREWYGNVDGDQYVDGWDLLADRAATSDSSHLWHLHMSFLRGHAGDDHSNLFAILTGAAALPTLGGRTMYVVNAPGDYTLWLSDGFQRKPIYTIEQASAYLTDGAAVRIADVPLEWFGKELAAGGPPVQFAPEQLAQLTAAARQGAHDGAADAVDGATIHIG